jgi:hypothetical protein
MMRRSLRVVVTGAVIGGAIAISSVSSLPSSAASAASTGGIASKSAKSVAPSFDVVQTKISVDGNIAVFRMQVSGKAGASRPTKTGKLAGARVFSYVWPTSLDSSTVGFEPKAGILALAATSHRDFDDTPLYDENNDGDPTNDGNVWHAHWVVLGPDDACGKGSLKVLDIPEGAKPKVPKTWPGLPILLDSPGWSPRLQANAIEIRVPFDDISAVASASFDGVTAGLRVNQSVHSPLLCVVDVFKIVSGDLSLPGKVGR